MNDVGVILFMVILVVGCGWGIYFIWTYNQLTVVYEDRNDAEILYDDKFLIKGKPDQILSNKRGFVVVEVKSATLPPNRRRPYHGDLIQLAAYLQLVSVNMGKVRYGEIRYQNKSFTVKWTRDLRKNLAAVVESMGQADQGEHPAFKPEPIKCHRCVYSSICDKVSL